MSCKPLQQVSFSKRRADRAPPLIADVRSHLDWSVVNRGAFLLRYKEPALRWINDADPYPRGHTLVLDEVNEERTVYLIADIR